MTIESLYQCAAEQCKTKYHWKKSTASLKMTYCSDSCERKDLGFSLTDLINGNYWYGKSKKEEEREEEELVIFEEMAIDLPEDDDDEPPYGDYIYA